MTDAPTKNANVYLAGPDGFTPVLLNWHREVLVPAVAAAGLVPLSPWEKFTEDFSEVLSMAPGPQRTTAMSELDYRVGAANAELIDASSGMLANLDGVDVDSGTASEIGYGSALGLVISGVRSDLRRSSENDGTQVNLQVEYFITHSGGHVHRTYEAAIAELVALILS
jgi:nucleoside 2-deoxyribosyltransferase